jgi:predicted negative regulator of RcsB-dependent stress response
MNLLARIKNFFGQLIIAIVVLGLIALPVSCEYKVWKECRQTNSYYYCVRVLDK